MNIACPKCGCNDVKKLSMIVKEGTASIDAKSKTSSIGVGSGGLGAAIHRGNIVGTQQSVLAREATKPIEKGVGLSSGFGLVIIGIILLISSIVTFVSYKWLSLIPFFLGIAAFVKGFSPAKHQTDKAAAEEKRKAGVGERRKWEKSWMCVRCGSKFLPNEPDSP